MLSKIIENIRSIYYAGNRYLCPICERGARKFITYAGRPLARCPHCGSFERHRLLWIALEQKWSNDLINKSGRLLHVAPEKILTQKLQSLYEYISIDLDGKRAMYPMDISKLEFPTHEFDAIICNHVLEHIPDDRAAMNELFRVLKPGGWGIIQVPISRKATYEDPSVKDPKDRLRVFGQDDHVRIYGDDFFDRLKEAGFLVTVLKKDDIVTPGEDKKYSLTITKEVIFVSKS
jgi:predicted SAM-dependent methyltransferase